MNQTPLEIARKKGKKKRKKERALEGISTAAPMGAIGYVGTKPPNPGIPQRRPTIESSPTLP
jgi:hypothetical protein